MSNINLNYRQLPGEDAATISTTITTTRADILQQPQKQHHENDLLTMKTTSARPTTPIPTKKLRPLRLSLKICENYPYKDDDGSRKEASSSTAAYQETDNSMLSNNSCNDAEDGSASTPYSVTSRSVFPHKQFQAFKKKLDIEFENLTYSVRTGFLTRGTKHILKNLTGGFRSGELSAIVGPSGAGKSTLLNLLSAYTPFGYTGDVKVNGRLRDTKAFKPNVAFITQDTSLQPFLTVKEAMTFAANLKIGPHMSKQEIKERVEKILEAMGMYENRNIRTGNLSGGQKKRLAIALELVNNPPVLFLDEPTTGLDSSTSYQCISLLKKLAMEGRTVICTIHQPSALTFKMFDHLYAVAEGQCIYSGGAENLVPFLAEVGLECPESYNPADYLMEIATNDYGNHNHILCAQVANGRNNSYRSSGISAKESQLKAMRKVDAMMQAGIMTPVTAPVFTPSGNYEGLPQFLQQQKAKKGTTKPLTPIEEMNSRFWDSRGLRPADSVDGPQRGGEKLVCNEQQLKANRKKEKKKQKLDLDPTHLCKRENIYASPFHRQLSILLVRTFLILWRDSSLTTLRFLIHLVVALLIGFLYYGIGNDAGNALNNFRYAFYAIMFVMYCAFSAIVVKFPLEFPIVSREHFNRWYSLRAYYIAMTLADIPIQLICTGIFIGITYIMTDQPMELMRLFLFTFIILLTALVAQSIGLTVGASLNVTLGSTLGPFFICPFLTFSGFFLQHKDAPIFIKWFFHVSFLKYSLDGAMLALFGYDRPKLECHDMYCHFSRPNIFLKDIDMAGANYEFSVIFLFVLFLLLRIIAFYIMSFRLRVFRT